MLVTDYIKRNRFDCIVAVPCSEIKQTLLELEETVGYIPATREDEAIGIAFGAKLAGKKPFVLMQNSGAMMCGNAILSLLIPYGIDIALGITIHDKAPQHKPAAAATRKVLNAMEYHSCVFIQNEELLPNDG